MRAQRGSVWLSAWLCATAAFSSFAQTGNQAQIVSIRRFEVAPTIDGRLDEPAWREAAALRDFHQTHPGDNTTPSYPTTIMLGYDNDPALRPTIARFIDHNAYAGVLRVRRDVGEQSSVGLIATSFDFIEKHNHLAGVDGRLSLNRNTFFTFQLLGANSRRFFYDPEADRNVYRTGNGFAYFTELNRTGRRLNLQLSGEGYTRDYRADLGFTTRTDTNRWAVYARYNSEPQPQRKLISWSALYTTLVQFDAATSGRFSSKCLTCFGGDSERGD